MRAVCVKSVVLAEITMFSGTIRMKICEACGLRPTDFQRRHNMTFGKPDEQLIDPYVSIDVDENHLGKCSGEHFLPLIPPQPPTHQ